MNEFAFQFAVLRYIHDPVTQEFINVGVVVFSQEARYIKASVSTKYSRLSDTFQGINGEHYRRIVSYIEHRLMRIHNMYQRRDMFEEPPPRIEMVLHQVLPPDDSSLVFGGYGGGLTADLDIELDRLYERLVTLYMGKGEDESRDDQQVWQVYRKELDKHQVTLHLSPVTISTPGYSYQFQYAWKNERYHPIEPISFDLVHGTTILDKANRWIGRAAILADSGQIGRLYMLLGAPRREELRKDYEKAISNMESKIPLPLELVEEKDAAVFSERLAKEINGHQPPD